MRSDTKLAKSGCEFPCIITISEADVVSISLRQRFGGRTLPNLKERDKEKKHEFCTIIRGIRIKYSYNKATFEQLHKQLDGEGRD